MGIEEEKFMTAERIERIHEYVVQAVHGLITKNEMATKIEQLFDAPFETEA
jgi:hypothetical protein